MRSVLVAMVSVAIGASPAAAETFRGWQYKAPKGYTLETRGDHLAFTKVTAPTFCSLALFATRTTDDAAVKEQAREWQHVVEANFTATGVRRAPATRTKRAFGVQPTLASIKDADGNEFAAQHYAVTPPGMIASVLLTSSTPASLAKCKPIAKAFLDSLAIDAASTVPEDPEARAETPVGRWAVGVNDDTGAVVREYTFAADGTYTFRSEAAGGRLKPEQWRVIEETGTFRVVGNQLTLAPAKATRTLHDETGAKPATKVALEKTTYTWAKRYLASANTWNLLLAPAKKTARDGELSDDARYVYSGGFQPVWKQDQPAPADPSSDAE